MLDGLDSSSIFQFLQSFSKYLRTFSSATIDITAPSCFTVFFTALSQSPSICLSFVFFYFHFIFRRISKIYLKENLPPLFFFGIYPKANVIARLEYELAYYDSAVHRFNHYTTRTPRQKSLEMSTNK